MRLTPASLPWLVLWDLRIRYRSLNLDRIRLLPLLLYGLFILATHAIAGFLLWGILHRGRSMSSAEALQFGTMMMSFLLFFMLMAAMLGGFRLVFAGRELSMYLGSPVPFARILWMRVLSLVIGAWMAAALLAVPVANMGALLGHPVFLLIYPVTLGLAICVSALSLLVVALALHTLGVRRARRLLQLLQALVPLAFVLLSFSRGRPAPQGSSVQLLSSSSFVQLSGLMQWPVRAASGDLPALLGFTLFCAALLWLSVRLVRFAIQAALQEPDIGPARTTAPSGRAIKAARFNRSLFRTLMAKEWRTILRDPRLASALLVQPLVVLPFFYLNLMHGRFRLAGAAAAAAFVAGQMSQFVANLMISAEEAPALLGTAPVPRARLIRYKCLAALLPVCALMLLPALWLAARDPWVGAVCLFCAIGAGFCACAIEVARPYPAPRRSFVQMQAARRKRDPLDLLGVLLIQIGWTAGAWFLADRNAWGALIVFGVILVPFFEWWRDANRQSLLGY